MPDRFGDKTLTQIAEERKRQGESKPYLRPSYGGTAHEKDRTILDYEYHVLTSPAKGAGLLLFAFVMLGLFVWGLIVAPLLGVLAFVVFLAVFVPMMRPVKTAGRIIVTADEIDVQGDDERFVLMRAAGVGMPRLHQAYRKDASTFFQVLIDYGETQTPIPGIFKKKQDAEEFAARLRAALMRDFSERPPPREPVAPPPRPATEPPGKRPGRL